MKGNETTRYSAVAALVAALWAGLAAPAASADAAGDYRQGVHDAAFPTELDVAKDLIPVTPSNKKLVWNDQGQVLVVSWKAQGSYDKFIKPYDKASENPAYPIWVTTAPQVQALCTEYLKKHAAAGKAGLNMRLRQLLGLDPTWNYDVFVELWVKPEDLFRPCVDPEVTDSTCKLQFSDTIPTVKGISNYKEYYENLYYNSYRASAGVPWTGLGYTYDWGNLPKPEGASEFIIVPGGAYTIKDAIPTMKYCGG